MARVVVAGGGYGGIAVAKALDDVAEVVLVEPREEFVHHNAALRALVDPEWTDRIFLPYGNLLRHGRILRDRVVRVGDGGGEVTLSSGRRVVADYVVLATGSAYPFPAKMDVFGTTAAKGRLRAAGEAVAEARAVLLLGAGPVGLELTGEIKDRWPDKAVTIVDPAADVLGGRYPDEFRAELRRQLDALGVTLLLGTSLVEEPVSEAGQAKAFTVTTRSGHRVSAGVWFRCFGVAPASGYLSGSPARTAAGTLRVTPHLRVDGHERVFALGDLVDLPEAKMARAAGMQADVVAANIRALIEGGALTVYRPASPGISLPLGARGGATYQEGIGVLGAERTAELKGGDLRTAAYVELLGPSRGR
jgi:NADH dehydrogenase FAD-containing subunit